MTERKSNIELLRIVCMFMIVIHHFATNVWFPGMTLPPRPGSTIETIVLLVYCLFFIGVNCFVLVSGYFSIKTSLRGFMHLYGVFVFYALLIALFQYFYSAEYATMAISEKCFHVAAHSLMPWDNNSYWFLNAYLALFMMAPLLNAAIASLSKENYIRVLVLLTILNVVFGNFFSIELLNTWGFSVAQFVYLYMIGGYIRNHISLETIKQHRWKNFSGYILSALIWGIFVAVQVFRIPFLGRFFKAFSYNNIYVLAASVCFFLFMQSFDIKSKAVNWFASSCIAVYLLQGAIPYGCYIDVIEKYPYLQNPLFMIVLSVLFLFVALLFDKIRIFLVTPLIRMNNIYAPKIEERLLQLYEKWK